MSRVGGEHSRSTRICVRSLAAGGWSCTSAEKRSWRESPRTSLQAGGGDMVSARRRLDRLEASTNTAERQANWSPEQEGSRARQFEDLFRELGMAQPPPIRNPEEIFEELFAEIARFRKETDREETA